MAALKSQRMYIPMSARNDADVSPADPYKKLNNYIGGSNWNGNGGAITWNIHAPADGWYQLGFHFRQTYLQESNSYRTLLIDGQIPFAQAQSIAFPYKSGWQYMRLEQMVYLTEGEHTRLTTAPFDRGRMAEVSLTVLQAEKQDGEVLVDALIRDGVLPEKKVLEFIEKY